MLSFPASLESAGASLAASKSVRALLAPWKAKEEFMLSLPASLESAGALLVALESVSAFLAPWKQATNVFQGVFTSATVGGLEAPPTTMATFCEGFRGMRPPLGSGTTDGCLRFM